MVYPPTATILLLPLKNTVPLTVSSVLSVFIRMVIRFLNPWDSWRHGLAHRYATLPCDELRIHDIYRLLENGIEQSLEGKPGDKFHAGCIGREIAAVDAFNGREPSRRDLDRKPAHLLGQLCIGFQHLRLLRRDHRGIDDIFCRPAVQDLDALPRNRDRHVLLGFDRACAEMGGNDNLVQSEERGFERGL